jgi:hypothetical protein
LNATNKADNPNNKVLNFILEFYPIKFLVNSSNLSILIVIDMASF